MYRIDGAGSPLSVSDCGSQAGGCRDAVTVPHDTVVQLALRNPPPVTRDASRSAMKSALLFLLALASAFIYIVVLRARRTGSLALLARTDGDPLSDERAPPRDRAFLAPVLLGLAAFVPTAYALATSANRSELTGADSAVLSRPLLALYVVGLVALVLVPVVTRPVPREDWLLAAFLLAYWLTGAVADISHGYSQGRLSFILVPAIVGAAIALRPSYEQSMTLLAWTTILVSAASLLLALVHPDAAFMPRTPPASSRRS